AGIKPQAVYLRLTVEATMQDHSQRRIQPWKCPEQRLST
ncbi:hypothetical protein AVEN_207955-1, partial [Araneus ventricosus]